MTEIEALERCDRLINGFSVNNSTYDAFRDDEKGYPTFAKMKEFAEECKSTLEKQIAKKPYRNHRNCLFWTCPTCNEEMYWDTDYGQQKFKNCSNCGQKLDWGNEDAE